MVKQLYINGTGSGSYGVYINSDTFLNSPTLDFEEYQIPAVNGNLIAFNKRLNNVTRKFDCYINENVLTNLGGFKKLIYNNTGYMRIESDYDSDTYQYGYLAQEIEVSPFRENESVKFTLYFSCKPQKWFKTNATGTKAISAGNPRITTILQRDNSMVKSAISLLPVDMQPTDDYFVEFMYTGVLSAQTVTNISASDSGGGLIIIARYSAENSISEWELIGYGYGSVSVPSYTFTKNLTTIYVLVPVGSGTITGSMTYSGGTNTISFDPSAYTLNVNNLNAFGMDMIYELDFVMNTNSTAVINPIVLSSSMNGAKISDAMIVIHFNQMDASLIQEIYTDYATDDTVTIRIDQDFNCYIIATGKQMDITSYLEFTGEIDGRCDSVTATFYKATTSNVGATKGGTLKPLWWCL